MVAHCCLFDWMFIYRQCMANLPPKLSDFCSRLLRHFDRLWDTKRMAAQASHIDSKIPMKLHSMFEYFKADYSADLL